MAPEPARTEGLDAPLVFGQARLDPLRESHRAGLREACAADPAIWDIYPYAMIGDAFERQFALMLGQRDAHVFAVLAEDRVVGMTSYRRIDPANRTIEIGGTYIAPGQRGTGFNGAMKRAMIGRAFDAGFRRVELRVDVRNARSMAAIRKIGGTLDGVLRRDRITWTGHVRDTAVFSILHDEWREDEAVSAPVHPR